MIIECVCRKRAAEAAKRHNAHHNHAISSDYELPDIKHVVYELTPPRRQWIQLPSKGRFTKLPGGTRQTISTLERTFRSCLWTIDRDKTKHPDQPYLLRLNAFVEGVKARIADPVYKIATPQTIPVIKKHKKEGPDEYRPICMFADLFDAVIIILANRYLSQLFDRYFYEDSLAFRPKRMFHGKLTTTFHHEAIALVLDYLERVKRRKVYVAECDMQKFYDTVDHSVVLAEYNRLMQRAQADHPGVSFDAVTRVFRSYLDCYTFTEVIWRKNSDPRFWQRFKIPYGKGAFGWVKHYKKMADDPSVAMPRVGVPQGGALSGLIANIVINRVDEKMQPLLHPTNDLYVRYCDDMLLLSANRRRCDRLFRLYSQEIKAAKLVPHAPVSERFGTPQYWDAKTKSVYQWTGNDLSKGSRWIGFVGYEINRDGDVRIRRSSIRKEKRKQRKVVSKLFELTYQKHRVEDDSLEYSLRGTLMSMAVGRATLWNYKTLNNEFCWINGFRMLNNNTYVCTQVRDLDRCRNHVIHQAIKRFAKLKSTVSGVIAKEGNKREEGEYGNRIKYYGLPFSYYYHYAKKFIKTKE